MYCDVLGVLRCVTCTVTSHFSEFARHEFENFQKNSLTRWAVIRPRDKCFMVDAAVLTEVRILLYCVITQTVFCSDWELFCLCPRVRTTLYSVAESVENFSSLAFLCRFEIMLAFYFLFAVLEKVMSYKDSALVGTVWTTTWAGNFYFHVLWYKTSPVTPGCKFRPNVSRPPSHCCMSSAFRFSF